MSEVGADPAKSDQNKLGCKFRRSSRTTSCSPHEVLRLEVSKVSASIDEVHQELAAAQQSGVTATDSYLRDTLLELHKE